MFINLLHNPSYESEFCTLEYQMDRPSHLIEHDPFWGLLWCDDGYVHDFFHAYRNVFSPFFFDEITELLSISSWHV